MRKFKTEGRSASAGLQENLSMIEKAQGKAIADLIRSFANDPATQKKMIDRALSMGAVA